MSGGPQGEVSAILTANLKALAEVAPRLVQRLHLPVDSSHLEERPGQPPRYRLQHSVANFVLLDATLESMAKGLGSPEELFVFGISLGEQVEHLLRTRPSGTKIIAWDRDPYLMRLALAARDFSHAIASGRLELHLGADLIALLPRTRHAQALFHPFLTKIYCNELELVLQPSDYPLVLLALGNLFFDDLARCLRGRGHIPYPIDLHGLSPEELDHCVDCVKPLYLMTVNLTHGATAFCERQALPLITWEIDPSADRPRPAPRPNHYTHIFSYRRRHAQQYRELGYEQVEYLPLAADTQKRAPRQLTGAEANEFSAPIAFVGSSLTESATTHRQNFLLRYGQWHPSGHNALDDCASTIKTLLARQQADDSQYLIPQLAVEFFGEFIASCKGDDHEDPIMQLAEMAAAEKRVRYAALLGPLGLRVWGDSAWSHLTATGLCYRGQAGHNDQLTSIYSHAAINVDLGRLYQMDIVTMRVFDVLACGGFLITEHSDALEELFNVGTELETYRSKEELLDKTSYYLANPDAAATIRSQARRAITDRHTIAQRVDHMLKASGIAE